LHRPILPVAVEQLPAALPRRLAHRQIIDYSRADQRVQAALLIQGGLSAVPAAPTVPDPLPPTPTAPLSYLTDLIDLITEPDTIDYDHQHQILQQLGAALRSIDPEERRGGLDLIDRFASRPDRRY
jgi:DNA-directed RNA polymerase specialized sigma24 family protein